MENKELFALGLGLERPWRIKSIELESTKAEKGTLHIYLDYKKGSKFEYEGSNYSVYDHHDRTWQHLNFFEHKCYLHARVPRIKTEEGKVKLVRVPWAGKGSSFSYKFEADIIDLISKNMSATAAGKRYNIGSQTVFRIIRKYVSHALALSLIHI